jgi:hypothetical protein
VAKSIAFTDMSESIDDDTHVEISVVHGSVANAEYPLMTGGFEGERRRVSLPTDSSAGLHVVAEITVPAKSASPDYRADERPTGDRAARRLRDRLARWLMSAERSSRSACAGAGRSVHAPLSRSAVYDGATTRTRSASRAS